MASGNEPARGAARLDWRRLLLTILAFPLFLGSFVFLPAGNLAWGRGWLLVLVFVLTSAVCALYLWRVNPEVVVARSRAHQGTKSWDRPLFVLILLTWAAVFLVAACDERFGWFPVPWWVCALGYALFLAGLALMTAAQAVNKFFEPTVRIQTDREHRVIDTGPYAVVRHPGYVGGSLLVAGIALALGSLWALVPTLLFCLVLVMRTVWEDQTLQAELPGYKEYAGRVRSKWIPGVW